MSAQPNLFAPSVPARETVNFYEIAARTKRGFGPEWGWYSMKVLGDGITEVRGIVPGPKGGKSRGKGDVVLVTVADVEAACVRYETETGRCRACFGTGREAAGWSSTEGARFRPCRRCHETGKPS